MGGGNQRLEDKIVLSDKKNRDSYFYKQNLAAPYVNQFVWKKKFSHFFLISVGTA